MIKSVQLITASKSEQDFKLLVRLLDLLGLRKGKGGKDKVGHWQEYLPGSFRLDSLFSPEKCWDDVNLVLTISDPDSAANVIQSLGLTITLDQSGPSPEHSYRTLRVELPDGTKLLLIGQRAAERVDHLGLEGKLIGRNRKFAIVVSRFNSLITERLLQGALDALVRTGVQHFKDIRIVRVPGSFEIPSAARTLAETRKYDAIICLGCLLRGDTAHYDVIVNEVTRGIGQSAQETRLPHAFGVLTCDTLEQAIDRAGLKMGNKGFEAALAAVEMANLKKAISTPHSAVSKNVVGRQSSVVGKPQKKSRPGAAHPKRKR
jgi:6,7-dimethyl-8-ribityllumazine synthase